ncbi:hypothetical protein EVAR_25036_1 [Eumeta japonica]|uniref:Uncharacterized protein n=1 Tax=Eumeta variegata TaxID=151549 RepID=A0A4C1V6K1_EUMVA|nr:hypothetical protein EVAR_25036_1 [Eumeta japonica]
MVKVIRDVVDVKEIRVGMDRGKKARNQKVVPHYASQEAIKHIETHIKIRKKGRDAHPLLKTREKTSRVVSGATSVARYTRIIKAGNVYVGLQRKPLRDQSPLVQCLRCLDRRKIAGALIQKPYVGNIGGLRQYCGWRVIQRVAPRTRQTVRPIKTAIIILGSDVDDEEDQTLIDKNVTATLITAGNCRTNVVWVYLESAKSIGPRFDRVKSVDSRQTKSS